MHRSKIIISIFLVIIVGGLFFLQNKFKAEVIHAVDTKLPENLKLEYAAMHVNVITGSVKLDSIDVKVLHANTNIAITLHANTLKVDGFNLGQFVFNKNIVINNIVFNQPQVVYHTYSKKQFQKSISTRNNDWDKTITIDNISVVDGVLKVKNGNTNTVFASINTIGFTLNNILLNKETLEQDIPFNYIDYQLTTKQVFMNLGVYETLKIDALRFGDKELNLKNISLKTKFTKEELSSIIEVERDHINLHIPELLIHEIDFGFANESLFVTANTGKIEQPNLSIYRDKRVVDDLQIKKMYSEMLRDLPFNLAIQSLEVSNGNIAYAERVEPHGQAGKLFFTAINANVTNLATKYKKGDTTKIQVHSNFMGKAPMDLNIRFDVNNMQDAFLASGQFKDFDAEIANAFFESNLNAKAEGDIEQIYFTFNGTKKSSKGDLKMKYKAFKFEILNQKNKVNTILTAIGNIFVNDGSKANEEGYRFGNIEAARNNTKSFFNYLWINVQSGLISTLTGNGSK